MDRLFGPGELRLSGRAVLLRPETTDNCHRSSWHCPLLLLSKCAGRAAAQRIVKTASLSTYTWCSDVFVRKQLIRTNYRLNQDGGNWWSIRWRWSDCRHWDMAHQGIAMLLVLAVVDANVRFAGLFRDPNRQESIWQFLFGRLVHHLECSLFLLSILLPSIWR